MSIRKKFGERVAFYRKQHEWSQADLARELTVDPSYVSSLESGKRNPSLKSLAVLARVLNVGLSDLVGGLETGEQISKSKYLFIPGYLKENYKRYKNQTWYHQRFDGCPYLMHMIGEAEVSVDSDIKQNTDFSMHFCFYEDGKADWYILQSDIDAVTAAVLQHASEGERWLKKFVSQWDSRNTAFYDFCKRLDDTNLHSLSDSELMLLHDDFVDTVLRRNSSSSTIDGFALGTDRLLADKLRVYFDESPLKKEMSFSEFFTGLTAPVYNSFVHQAECALLELVKSLEKEKDSKRKLLKDYQSRFFWLKNNYIDSHILSLEYIETEAAKIASSGYDIDHEINSIKNSVAVNKKLKSALLGKVTLDSETRFLIRVTEEFTHWQDERKRATLFTSHYSMLLLSEISRRTGISLEYLKYMSPREVGQIFAHKPNVKVLTSRREKTVFYWDKNGHDAAVGALVDKVQHMVAPDEEHNQINDFRGLTASIGKASGRVRIVKTVKEIDKVNSGDILVAVMTRPDYVPAMKKAAAIVTDEGGITSHAAIVSRELKIPCVIGTKIATKILKDGDLVEVDASHSVVKILERVQK